MAQNLNQLDIYAEAFRAADKGTSRLTAKFWTRLVWTIFFEDFTSLLYLEELYLKIKKKEISLAERQNKIDKLDAA